MRACHALSTPPSPPKTKLPLTASRGDCVSLRIVRTHVYCKLQRRCEDTTAWHVVVVVVLVHSNDPPGETHLIEASLAREKSYLLLPSGLLYYAAARERHRQTLAVLRSIISSAGTAMWTVCFVFVVFFSPPTKRSSARHFRFYFWFLFCPSLSALTVVLLCPHSGAVVSFPRRHWRRDD